MAGLRNYYLANSKWHLADNRFSYFSDGRGVVHKKRNSDWFPVTPEEGRALPPLPYALVQGWLFEGAT